jgi:hypothetical protein
VSHGRCEVSFGKIDPDKHQGRTVQQSVDMWVPEKWFSLKESHCVKESIAVKPAAIGHRNHRLSFRDKLAVEENPHGPINAWVCASGKPIGNNFSGYVGQSKIATLKTIDQAFVINPEPIEDCCMKVVWVNGIFFNTPTNIIGFSVYLATFQSAASKCHGKAEGVVVTAGVGGASATVLAKWGTAKLGTPDDHGAV